MNFHQRLANVNIDTIDKAHCHSSCICNLLSDSKIEVIEGGELLSIRSAAGEIGLAKSTNIEPSFLTAYMYEDGCNEAQERDGRNDTRKQCAP